MVLCVLHLFLDNCTHCLHVPPPAKKDFDMTLTCFSLTQINKSLELHSSEQKRPQQLAFSRACVRSSSSNQKESERKHSVQRHGEIGLFSFTHSVFVVMKFRS